MYEEFQKAAFFKNKNNNNKPKYEKKNEMLIRPKVVSWKNFFLWKSIVFSAQNMFSITVHLPPFID